MAECKLFNFAELLVRRIARRCEFFDVDDLQDLPIRQIVRLLIEDGYLTIDMETNTLKTIKDVG